MVGNRRTGLIYLMFGDTLSVKKKSAKSEKKIGFGLKFRPTKNFKSYVFIVIIGD